MFIRRIKKSASLRVVNFIGLSVVFASLLLSYTHIKKELSYDRFHENANRIVRYSAQFDNEPIDGRNYGFSKSHPIATSVPGIQDIVLFEKVNTGLLTYNNKSQVINDFLISSSNFFQIFSFPLVQGDKNTVLDSSEKAVVSERYAKQLFGDESPIGKSIKLTGRKFKDRTVFISGVFADFPETSHIQTELIMHHPDMEDDYFAYVYLLLDAQTTLQSVSEGITSKLTELSKEYERKMSAQLMPITDIHLHSKILRELEVNGNIHYLYLIAGANILLLGIVLFNLWLNAGLIFSFNRRYYQLLRLNGASASTVITNESTFALILGMLSVFISSLVLVLWFPDFLLHSALTLKEFIGISILFILLVLGVSLIPPLKGMSTTLLVNMQNNLPPSGFSLPNVKYMLMAQYAMVMFIVIVSVVITKQIQYIKSSQVGGMDSSILVMNEQPEPIKERYELFKSELLKHPEIEYCSSAMQLPGSAIRDAIYVWTEEKGEESGMMLPLLVVGDDFLPFFDITPIAGRAFKNNNISFSEEAKLLDAQLSGTNQSTSNHTEEYVLNRKAVQALGFQSPEEAIGKYLHIKQQALQYIDRGIIVGVTDNFNYTTTYEDAAPQLIMQRKMFQHCILVKLSEENKKEALAAFNQVWNQVYPDYVADYTFLNNIYQNIYQNELNAETLIRIFSLLCLIIANLGLIIIMAFVIKRRTKEIGVRKVNGATPIDIIRMLNNRFVAWVGIAFLFAVPISYLVARRWLENFAYKTSLDWWLFAFSGLSVLSLSIVVISWQSYHAAMLNPVKALKTS